MTVRKIVLHPVNIRHVPVVTGQPKHILVETFDRKTETWKTVCDLTLPLFDEKHPHRIGTNGFRTELIRLICDEEHRVPPSRGEWYASPDVVPIRIFENTEIFGEECSSLFLPPYNPPLTKGKTAPSAIANTEISVKEHLVSYKSRYMHLVFSLKRPILLKMAFDPEGNGKTDVNILYDKTVWQAEFIGRPNCVIGPRFVSATQNLNSMSFTGEVELDGNAVLYKNLHCNDLFSMDLRFSVSETGFTVSVNKTCHTDFTAIESDDFDFVLDCDKTISGFRACPGPLWLYPLPCGHIPCFLFRFSRRHPPCFFGKNRRSRPVPYLLERSHRGAGVPLRFRGIFQQLSFGKLSQLRIPYRGNGAVFYRSKKRTFRARSAPLYGGMFFEKRTRLRR